MAAINYLAKHLSVGWWFMITESGWKGGQQKGGQGKMADINIQRSIPEKMVQSEKDYKTLLIMPKMFKFLSSLVYRAFFYHIFLLYFYRCSTTGTDQRDRPIATSDKEQKKNILIVKGFFCWLFCTPFFCPPFWLSAFLLSAFSTAPWLQQ